MVFLKTSLLLVTLSFAWLLGACSSEQKNQTIAPEDAGEQVEVKHKVDPSEIRDIRAVINTSQGDIHVLLYAPQTPVTVANFVNLARRGYYNNVTFHRVIPGFMIQGGDPTGTGRGNPGYRFEDETRRDLLHHSAGILSMANSGPATNGSQFFITHAATPHLDGRHTVFGRVTAGMDVVYKIKQGDRITGISILDNTDALMKKEGDRIREWNSILGS